MLCIPNPLSGTTKKAGRAVAKAIRTLAKFLEAKKIVYGKNVPDNWREILTE